MTAIVISGSLYVLAVAVLGWLYYMIRDEPPCDATCPHCGTRRADGRLMQCGCTWCREKA